LRAAKQGPNMKVLAGGEMRGEEGWLGGPTVGERGGAKAPLISGEIFGPVVARHGFKGARWGDTARLVGETSPDPPHGAGLARERGVTERAAQRRPRAPGNVYINDKPPGAVVGQQPFGGARASGTNDKPGSLWNLSRWVPPRTIKENFAPPVELKYPFMAE